MKHDMACRVCGGRLGWGVLLTIKKPDRFERFVGIPEKGYTRRWVECGMCGAAIDLHDPRYRGKLKKLGTAYSTVDFASSSIADKFKKVMAMPPEKSDNAQRALRIHTFMNDWMQRYFPHAAGKLLKVVDIGAGTGVFLSRFLEKAQSSLRWKGIAVESDPLACKHLLSLKRFRVVEETFPGKTSFRNIALCTLNKVVEHVRNPLPFLQKIQRMLSPKFGILYIELPDKMTIDHRPPTDNILGALHHHLYDSKSIVVLLERSGFVPFQVMRFFEPSGKITIAAFATLQLVINALAKG